MADETGAPKAPPKSFELEWKDGKLRYPLTRKIPAEGDDVSEITLREPDTGDIATVGNPVQYNPFPGPGEQRIAFHDDRMVAMISRLANLPPSSIKKLIPQDYTAIAWVLAGFFIPVVFS